MGVLILTTIRVIKMTNVTIPHFLFNDYLVGLTEIMQRANEYTETIFTGHNEFND